MTTNAKTAKTRKNRKPAPVAEAPEAEAPETAPAPEAVLEAPAAPESPEAEAPAESPAEAAERAALEAEAKLADLKARHAALCEEIRQAKLGVGEAAKAAFRAAHPKQVGCAEAAFRLLKDFPAGLNAKDIVRRLYDRGLWKSPAGLTPDATLYAAIIRDISAKGAASRFARGEKAGTFVANPLLGENA